MMSSQPGRNTRMAPWKRGRKKEGEREMERKGGGGRVIFLLLLFSHSTLSIPLV